MEHVAQKTSVRMEKHLKSGRYIFLSERWVFYLIFVNSIMQMEKRQNVSLAKQKKRPPQVAITSEKLDLHNLIQQLKIKQALPKELLLDIISQASSILKNQPTVLKVASPVIVVGDIHGQFYDLLNLFERFGYPPNTQYLFLGDYVDRGRFCIEVITTLLILKVNYPNKIFLMRGNHEGRTMTTAFNFKQQCQYKYQSGIYQVFIDLFTTLPLCAVIDGRYFAVHGGISPHIKTVAEIEKVNRFVEIPEQGTLCDLMWSDPVDENRQQWAVNKNRSCSYFYSRNHATKFLKDNGLRLIIRGHEVQMLGYKYQYGSNHQPLTLTIFSAPRYCDTYRNKGAVAMFTGKAISIQSYKQVQHPFVMNNYLNAFQVSFPSMASSVAKIFAHLLRNHKVRRSINGIKLADRAEIMKALEQVESIGEVLKSNEEEIKDMLSEEREGGKDKYENQMQEIMGQFADEEKFSKVNERMPLPLIFGPKGLQFVRVRVKSGGSQEDVSPE